MCELQPEVLLEQAALVPHGIGKHVTTVMADLKYATVQS
jgi:hypothetical protein